MNPHCARHQGIRDLIIFSKYFLELWVTGASDGDDTCLQYQYFACLINRWSQIAIRKLARDFLRQYFILSQEMGSN